MRFTVDLDELNAVVGDMVAFEDRLRAKLAELDQLVAELHLTWTGQAADAQRSAHARWKAGAEEMHHGLVEMRQAGRRAHANYTAAAEANASMWRGAR